MTTKEEYEKALKEMNEAFYGITFLRSETRRFDENLNLLRELVNEHFEEKAETNYEYFEDEIIENCGFTFALVGGKPHKCACVNCNDCGFSTGHGCTEKIKEWLKKPHEKPVSVYKLTKFEYDLLNTYKDSGMRKGIFNYSTLLGLQGKGYFKDINTSIPIYEILDNCEVIE